MMPFRPPQIEIRDTGTPKGLGVFAASTFEQFDIVEVCPVVVFVGLWNSMPESLQKRVFNWTVLAHQAPNTHAIAMGYGSMYNGANPANMRYEAESDSRMRFIAVRTISVGEELTINYSSIGGAAEWHDDNWFERLKVQPL
jgi:uncharacterized protein